MRCPREARLASERVEEGFSRLAAKLSDQPAAREPAALVSDLHAEQEGQIREKLAAAYIVGAIKVGLGVSVGHAAKQHAR